MGDEKYGRRLNRCVRFNRGFRHYHQQLGGLKEPQEETKRRLETIIENTPHLLPRIHDIRNIINVNEISRRQRERERREENKEREDAIMELMMVPAEERNLASYLEYMDDSD